MRINITNTEKLENAIKAAEGRATARTVTVRDIKKVLDKVGVGITKKALHGTKVLYNGAEHFPNAYRYRPESTHWEAEYSHGKWYVTSIHRAECPNRTSWNTEIQYSPEARRELLENAMYVNY